MNKLLTNEKGLSLIEVVVSLALVAVILTVMINAVMASKVLLRESRIKTDSNTLAQEGIEIVKNQIQSDCFLSNILASGTNNPVNPTLDFFYIESDTGLSAKLDIKKTATGSPMPNRVPIYSMYAPATPTAEPKVTRIIHVYKLSDLAGRSGFTWVNANFTAANPSFDGQDDYYYVEVEIIWTEKGDRTTKLSTIISKP